MAFGWAGAARGASESLQDQLVRAFAQRQQEQQMALERNRDARADAQLRMVQEQQRLANAALTLEQLDAVGPGVTVTPDIAAQLRGTPYGARVEDKLTLPSASIPGVGGIESSDPGGAAYSTLHPTLAQQREAGQHAELRRMSEDTTLSPEMRRWVSARRAGVSVPNPESFITEDQREARAARERAADLADFRKRAGIQQGIAEAAERRRANQVFPKDRLQARRFAIQDATDVYEAQKDTFGMVPPGTPSIEEIAAELEQRYVSELGSVTADGSQRRVIGQLRQIMPEPGRTGAPMRDVAAPRLIGDFVVARNGRVATPTPSGTASGDPYERYLARQRRMSGQ